MFSNRLVRSSVLALVLLGMVTVPALAHVPEPIEIAAQFLSLSPDQIAEMVAIHRAAQELAEPVARELAARKAVLATLLDDPDPHPAEIGVVALSIHALENQLAALHHEAAQRLRSILDESQLDRLRAAARAKPLCYAIPGLTALHLL